MLRVTRKVANAVLTFTLLCMLACLASTSVLAQCHSPKYREAQVWDNSESSLLMAISIPLSDFAPARLICLAQTLRQKYHDRKNITILIFSSLDAAKRYMPHGPDYLPAKNSKQAKLQSSAFWLSHLHGFYSYDSEKREEYLDIRPLGSDAHGPNDTRIDLPVVQTPHCRLETSGRCMLALDEVSYPGAELDAKVSGTITLTGSIAPGGKITDINVAEAHVSPQEKTEMLVAQAIQNFKTWRLEPASRQDDIRTTYSYVIDPSLPIPEPYHRQVDVQFALPNQVTIRGHSLE